MLNKGALGESRFMFAVFRIYVRRTHASGTIPLTMMKNGAHGSISMELH